MSRAFVFPGQGAQTIGMGKALAEAYPAAKAVFDAVDEALGQKLSALIWEGSIEELTLTMNAQPALMATSIAALRALESEGIGVETAAFVAGHSLGEYAALVASGSLDFASAMKLVKARSQAMQDAVPAGVGGMAAVLGIEPGPLAEVCDKAAQGEVVACCNLNAPGQIVIGGHKTAVERAIVLAKEAGAKRAMLLPMSVPSHCELMRPAAAALASALNAAVFAPPQIAVIHNATVDVAGDAAAIRAVLADQLFKPVRWIETVEKMAAQGVTHIIECGPGKVLAGMVKRIAPDVKCLTLADKASFEAALAELIA